MGALLEKAGVRGKLRANFWSVALLGLAASAIFGLPYFRFEYYDAYVATYGLTNTQMGVLGSVVGVCGVVSYLFGGVVADGLPVRRVIAASLLATGVAGLAHLLPLSFYGLVPVYVVLGVSTTFAFQPACVKAVRLMADRQDAGKAYGYYEGISGVAGAIVSMCALAIFAWGVSAAGSKVGAMRAAIVFYALLNIALGLGALRLVRGGDVRIRAGRAVFRGFGRLLREPVVWVICLVGFCNNVLCLSVYYYIPYGTDVMGLSVAVGALLGVFRKWGGFAGDIGGGYLADRFGCGKVMLGAYAVVLAAQLAMMAVPAQRAWAWAVSALFVVLFTFFSVNKAMSWTMLVEADVPVEAAGAAAGLVCTASAVPEAFVSLLAGSIIDAAPGAAGFRAFFWFLAAVTAVGLALMIVYNRYLARRGRDETGPLPERSESACRSCRGGVATVDDAPGGGAGRPAREGRRKEGGACDG